MTRRRWFADEVSGDRAALVGAHATHLVQVLRAQLGQQFDISTVSGVREGRIVNIAPERVEFELGDVLDAAQVLDLTLLLSIFKFDRMEWAIEKCVELGVARIIPVIARRTESHLAAAAVKRSERWRKIAVQAVEQSRRTHLPQISAPAKLTEAVKSHTGTRVVLSEVEHTRTLKSGFVDHSMGPITLAIGPEGGWTSEELQSFVQAGWISASLGNTILRVETAAIAAVAITISTLS
jgi:16S rRNA (uracil1498-N3)-methyltransferase